MASRTYDQESGQVFTETIMTFNQERPWEYRSQRITSEKDKAFLDRNTPQHKGPKTLQDLCMKKLVAHSNTLQPETLENVPHDIATRIWTAIRREWCESFHVWKVFVSAGFCLQPCTYALSIRDWRLRPLIDTFSKLSSPQCIWMVDLTLSNVRLSAAEFKEVSRIENLQTLHIQHENSAKARDFDNRVVEGWSNRAAEEDAFKHLQTLSMANVPAITSRVFYHLSNFPRLDFVICAGGPGFETKGFAKNARNCGWSQIKANPATYPGTSTLFRGEKISRDIREVRTSRRPPETKSSTMAAKLDVELGKLERMKAHTRLSLVLCFKRDHGPAAKSHDKAVVDNAGPRKRRRMNESKAEDFAAMLGGD